MSLYKIDKYIQSLKSWDRGFISTTGEVIHYRLKEGNYTTVRRRRDTPQDIAKILYLEAEALRLRQNKHDLSYNSAIENSFLDVFWG